MAMNPRLLRPVATGFNPASISGIVHWWDANDSATLTLSSGSVEAWASKAGAKISATQTTANNRPTTTTVNGKTALLFDGSNDGLNFTGTSRTDETWILVAEQTENQVGTRALINDGGQGDGLITLVISGNRMLRAEYAQGITGGATENNVRFTVQSATGSIAMPASVISSPRSSSGGIGIRINGTARESYISAGTFFSTTAANQTVQRIGFYNSTTWPFKGWIGEILCWSCALSASEMLKCERYLGKKWGITVA